MGGCRVGGFVLGVNQRIGLHRQSLCLYGSEKASVKIMAKIINFHRKLVMKNCRCFLSSIRWFSFSHHRLNITVSLWVQLTLWKNYCIHQNHLGIYSLIWWLDWLLFLLWDCSWFAEGDQVILLIFSHLADSFFTPVVISWVKHESPKFTHKHANQRQ